MNKSLLPIIRKYSLARVKDIDLLEKTEMSKTVIYNIMTGRSTPSLTQVEEIAKALNMEIQIIDKAKKRIIISKEDDDTWQVELYENDKVTLLERIELETVPRDQYRAHFVLEISKYIIMGYEIQIRIS